MKRLCMILLPLLLLFAACDLRNRQPSENFIPAEPRPQTQPTQIDPTETELPVPTGIGGITTVFEEKGTYTDAEGTAWSYVYRLPFVDLASRDAATCNQEIDRDFRTVIAAQFAKMDRLEPLTVSTVDYDKWENGEILTLVLRQVDAEGGETRTYYSLLSNGDLARREDLLLQAELVPETFDRVLEEQVTAWYTSQYEDAELGYTAWLQRTVNDLNQVRMHLDKEGRLEVLFLNHAPDGSVDWQELIIEP